MPERVDSALSKRQSRADREVEIVHNALARADARAETYRVALERAGRALNRAGWVDESQAVLDVLKANR